ncbi:hypothetical protein D3C87_1958010 [compost metagenome]
MQIRTRHLVRVFFIVTRPERDITDGPKPGQQTFIGTFGMHADELQLFGVLVLHGCTG